MTSLLQWDRFDVSEGFLPSATVQCHAANLLALDDDLLCVWFGGTQEGLHDIDIYLSRCPLSGGSWSSPEKLSNDEERSEQNPVLFDSPEGDLWLFWTAQVAGNQDEAEVRCRVSKDRGRTWSDQRTLFQPDDRGGMFVRQPPVVRDDGGWLLPVFRCGSIAGEAWSGHNDHSAVRVSTDQGASWTEVVIPESRGLVHPCLAPDPEGSGFVALFRSRFADNVYVAWADASGENWSSPAPTGLPNNNSSIQAINWSGDELALVYNHSSRHDATSRRTSLYDEVADGDISTGGPALEVASARDGEAFWGAPRAPLSLAVSNDSGRSWARVANLATGDGYCLTNNSRDGLNRELSYPSLVRDRRGDLHVAFTHHRRQIKHVRISARG